MILVVILAVCLCITTVALVYSTILIDHHVFQTGTVKINLNDGKPVISEKEFLFEPGMTIEKNFFVENESTLDVYYKLYVDDMQGNLADILDVSIRHGETILFIGKAGDLTQAKGGAVDDVLKLNEVRELTISFHLPEEYENNTQNLYLSFALKADAVQAPNNPYKLFD